MRLQFDFAIASDRGLVRDNNEDSAYAGPQLIAIADGMGGHAAGEVASEIMVSHMARLEARAAQEPEAFAESDHASLLSSFAGDANAQMRETISQRPETEGMGTTLTAMMLDAQAAALTVAHVGDSRGYMLRDGQLEQVTVDDTFVQSLVNQGQLAPEDVSSHPSKSIILKAYMGEPVSPTIYHLDAREGDRLLLCSDGLSDPVTASTIQDALGTGSPAAAAQKLVDLALRSGGPDNVTVVVADVATHGPGAPAFGGAPAADGLEVAHPDTAAGRAAALSRQPQKIEPLAPAEAQEEEKGASPLRWLAIIMSVLVLVGIAGFGWWGYSYAQDNHFLSVDDEGDFLIEQGVDYAVFGRDLHQPVQQACINAEGQLRFIDVGTSIPADCQLFNVEDLPETTRASLSAMEGGSYDEVTQRLRRLAEDALPECLHRESEAAGGSDDLTQPGINCREVNSNEEAV